MGCNCCMKKLASTIVQVVGAVVQINTPDVPLELETKYCLILAQPVPVAGYNLPVQIVVGANPAIPLHKYGYGNIEYGEDLPKCRNRIPLYYNNAGEFVDLRRHEREAYYCK